MIGDTPTNLMAVQDGLESVRVAWTDPIVLPGLGYEITTIPSTSTTTSTGSPQTLHNIYIPGVYTIQLISRSQHFPIGMIEVTGVMVLGEDNHIVIFQYSSKK